MLSLAGNAYRGNPGAQDYRYRPSYSFENNNIPNAGMGVVMVSTEFAVIESLSDTLLKYTLYIVNTGLIVYYA